MGPALLLTLGGCSAGDLTLPGSNQPGSPLPAALQVVSGDGQQGQPGTTLDQPLTVRAVDDSARPVSGTAVHFAFQVDVSGATIDPPSVLTDGDGQAAAVVRLGDTVGEQVIVAEVVNTGGQDLRATFTATAVAPDSGNGKKGDGQGNGHGGSGGD
jgi:hypothetical protein